MPTPQPATDVDVPGPCPRPPAVILPATSALVVDAALVLSATMPAAGAAIRELMSMEGHEIHTVNPQPFLAGGVAIEFGNLGRHFPGAVVVGILRNRGAGAKIQSSPRGSRFWRRQYATAGTATSVHLAHRLDVSHHSAGLLRPPRNLGAPRPVTPCH